MELNKNFAKGTTYPADEWSLYEERPHALLTQKEELKARKEDLTTKRWIMIIWEPKEEIERSDENIFFPLP